MTVSRTDISQQSLHPTFSIFYSFARLPERNTWTEASEPRQLGGNFARLLQR